MEQLLLCSSRQIFPWVCPFAGKLLQSLHPIKEREYIELERAVAEGQFAATNTWSIIFAEELMVQRSAFTTCLRWSRFAS